MSFPAHPHTTEFTVIPAKVPCSQPGSVQGASSRQASGLGNHWWTLTLVMAPSLPKVGWLVNTVRVPSTEDSFHEGHEVIPLPSCFFVSFVDASTRPGVTLRQP